MYSTPDQPQQWSVHAEFTISHPGIKNPLNPPKTDTIQDEKGVRMLYSWTANDQSDSGSGGSTKADPDKLYGFQKGNLFFTSTPPNKPLLSVQHDSAYGSDFCSPSTCGTSYHRKCKSTCNIVLSGKAASSSCGRTQSLRCQTPSACCDKKTEGYYGCGDPWCHHVRYVDDDRRISPVRELCEDFNDACTICNRDYKVKRDVSVQTYEMVNKCTSPMPNSFETIGKSESAGKGTKLKRARAIAYNRSRQSSARSSTSPLSIKRDDSQDLPRLSRSSSYRGTPPKTVDKKDSASEKSDSSKKPRTIHIDVYCTGTELESSDSSSTSDSDTRSKTVSTPQTVFESKNMCVTREKADDKKLPYHLSKVDSTSIEKDESDNDDSISTSYPSKMSSYSTIGRSLSSMTSFQSSAISSCTVPDYESSVGNTSWKDTFSDIDSLLHSRSSIPQNDSLYFVPQRIDEEVSSTGGGSRKNTTSTTNSVNLAPSDSFDYADSEDKLRIKRMERMWKYKLLQNYNLQSKQEQQNLQEIVDKRLNKMNISKDSDSDASDGSEKGWTILKGVEVSQKYKPEVAKSNSTPKVFSSKPNMIADVKTMQYLSNQVPQRQAFIPIQRENSIQSDSSSVTCKSPSALLIKQRLSADPSLRSPFTIVPGKYTEPRHIAKRFGPVITVFKKPGHHVGPAKNPGCSCDHCRSYFQNVGYRSRTCSLGDTPTSPPLFLNWKGLKKTSQRYSDC